MDEIRISTTEKNEILNITDKIERIVANSAVKEGTSRQQPTVQSCRSRTCICLVYAPHATAAVIIMGADGAVENDVLHSLSNIVPKSARYEHEHNTVGHGAAHVKSGLFGPSQAIPVSQGRLQLGTWQSIVFCELGGPRDDRKVLVQVVGR